MSDIPFPIAGGTLKPAAFPLSTSTPLADPSETARGSRRRRLWEVAHKCHCPIVGVCFGVAELRALMGRIMEVPRDADDFVLHTTAVAACESRGPLSELLHKTLEKRFAQDVRRSTTAKGTPALQALWRQALARGDGIPGALWTCWTHPACDKALEQEIYSAIHMLQHQLGSSTRSDLDALRKLQADKARLHTELVASRHEMEVLRAEKAREVALLGERVAALRTELAGKEAWAAGLAGQLETLRNTLPDLRDRQILARRASDAEARAIALTARAAILESEVDRLRRLHRQAEDTLAALLAPAAAESEPPAVPATLQGKCVLCVGGRAGTIEAYRQLVEAGGGRFLHHDGGLEESLHRIDAALAAADLVVCQAGCISHNAYWRVKEQCKRTGKRCLFMKTTGVSSFARSVAGATLEGNIGADGGS